MSTIVLSLLDQAFGEGRTYWVVGDNPAYAVTHDFVIRADCEIRFDNMFLQSDNEIISWQIFAQPTFDEEAPQVPITSARVTAGYQPKAQAWVNPTVTDPGIVASAPRRILGQQVPGNNSYIDVDLFKGKLGSIPAGFTYLLRFTKISGTGADIYISMYGSEPECFS